MINFSDKSCRQNRNTRFVFNNFKKKNRAAFEIMWENIVQPGRQQEPIWRVRTACWIPKTTNAHSECVIPIVFPL